MKYAIAMVGIGIEAGVLNEAGSSCPFIDKKQAAEWQHGAGVAA